MIKTTPKVGSGPNLKDPRIGKTGYRENELDTSPQRMTLYAVTPNEEMTGVVHEVRGTRKV